MTVEGVSSLLAKFKALPTDVKTASPEAAHLAALDYQGKLIRTLNSGGRTGKIYTKGTVSHQSSAPGEPPKSDLGNLANSIAVRRNKLDMSSEVYSGLISSLGGSPIPRAIYLEFGTSKMEPRPMWEPIFKENAARYKKMVADAVLKKIKKRSKK